MQVKALLSLGLLAGVGAVSTLAAWTGEATAMSSIAAGTVALGVGGAGGTVSSSYPLPIDGAAWYPGVSRAALVTVKNTGTLAAPYAISGAVAESGVGKLGAGLQIIVTSGAMVGGSTCNGPMVLQKNPGASFGAASAPVQLAAGGEQVLCVQYSLPAGAPNALQGNSTTVTLTFTATVGVS